jgi:cellulose synthase operon protein C
MKFFTARWKRWTFVLVALAVLLPAGYWGGRRLVWPKVKAWRAERMNKEARDFLAAGDDANALLTSRKILQASPNNLEAWRIAATAARKRKTIDVVFYQNNVARLEPTKANYLELIRLALEFDAVKPAADGIEAIAAKANDDPEFHTLAAQYYRRMGKTVAAKFHLIALTQLKPSDREAQLALAQLEMAEDPDRKDRALRARVRALAEDPTLRVRALTLLLRESIKARLPAETAELIARLQPIPDLSVNDRLLLLEGSTLLDGPSLPVLEKLQVEVVGKPVEVTRVMEFLFRTKQYDKTLAWFATLPDETKKDENVRRAVAETLLAMGKWPELEAHLKSTVWPNGDYLRHAFLAYSYRARGRVVDFNDAWKTAVVAVGLDRRKINELMMRTGEWKWLDERYDLVWKIFSITPTDTQVQQALVNWERRQPVVIDGQQRFGRTANINKIFARIVEVAPGDALARNNLAYTSLLLDSNVTRANLLAAQLAQAMPKNPFIITTYAFSLYKQGKADEALAKIESLSASELSVPDRVLLRAVFLARLGQSDRAAEMLKGIDLKRLLPEEQRLSETALAEMARNARTQDDKTRLSSMKQTPAGDAAGWLGLITPETRTAATVDMQLTDPLYAAGNWAGLQAALRRTDWKTENYLRLALLAYAARAQNDLVQSRDSWKQAVGAAERNATRGENLRMLTTHWNWPAERVDAMNIVFERTPTDRVLLGELLKHYRDVKRTQDIIRILTQYVSRTSDTTDEAVAQAYYSLISDTNVSRAHVLAKNAFESAPDDQTRRLVYAFSLWKQRRAAEAGALLAAMQSAGVSDLVPAALVRAAIDADLGQGEEARNSLALFNAENALPDETALADKITLQLSRQNEPGKTSKN